MTTAARPLEGRVALVTGASRGLGASAAIELGRLGARVVMVARTQGGLEETDDAIQGVGGSASLLPLDLHEVDQLDAIGPSLYQRFQRLDILVHCAGALGRITPVAHLATDEWANALAVNLSATWRLIRSCDALLRAAEAGRAVFVTCARAREPKAYWGAYGTTKAAMEHLVLTWADEVRGSRLRVNLFDPGPMATRLRREAYPGELPDTPPTPDNAAQALVAFCLPDCVRHGELVAR